MTYLVDGHAIAMDRQEVTVTVRDPAGQLSTVTRTLYSSRYGPVLGTGWRTENAFAVRDAGADNYPQLTRASRSSAQRHRAG